MALTGYWSNGVCVDNQAEAINLLASQFPLIDNGIVYHLISISAAGTTGATINVYASSINSTVATVYVQRNIYFLPCDPTVTSSLNVQMFNDGLSMGWGIVAATFAAFAVVFLARAFHR